MSFPLQNIASWKFLARSVEKCIKMPDQQNVIFAIVPNTKNGELDIPNFSTSCS
jgi:hypothetical protein